MYHVPRDISRSDLVNVTIEVKQLKKQELTIPVLSESDYLNVNSQYDGGTLGYSYRSH